MAISERVLEDNEAKIDNILHKIINANKHIQELSSSIEHMDIQDYAVAIKERTKQIEILSDTIANLATLADEIDLESEKITPELGTKIRTELEEAIDKIKDANLLLEKDVEKF